MGAVKKGDRVRAVTIYEKNSVTGKVVALSGERLVLAHEALVRVDREYGEPRNRYVRLDSIVPLGRGFAPGIDGEVKEAERRSARLRALRKLANDLGYTLVKNPA